MVNYSYIVLLYNLMHICKLETYGERGTKQEVRNERALSVYNRVQNKLTGLSSIVFCLIWLTKDKPGRDFNPDVALDVPSQVSKLISQATSLENLCQCFSGWYAFKISHFRITAYMNNVRCAFW